MAAITGDGSLRALVQASILRRELTELGAWWHGLDWSTHALVGHDDDAEQPVVFDTSLYPMMPTGLLDASTWTWEEPPPADWRPHAERDETTGTVAVRLITYSELGASVLYEHRDVYASGGALLRTNEHSRRLGTGAGGYVF